ncbi:integrase core domain-containing protein [Roseomonas chloroacetimidivorans]|uniref:integrase core domain-containing protein n=1 Tax=Roseomonas chloroacetimidivorans TaxID=1766656 RepID=UPI003C71DB7E
MRSSTIPLGSTVQEVAVLTEAWRQHYNLGRPHSALRLPTTRPENISDRPPPHVPGLWPNKIGRQQPRLSSTNVQPGARNAALVYKVPAVPSFYLSPPGRACSGVVCGRKGADPTPGCAVGQHPPIRRNRVRMTGVPFGA